ncbi:Gfo/Idh/MocA family oxidoreductase [Tissierella sp.]|uniref:Gfo/Idh/MocA family protein n=1 Tax=Tissierella sp. TaxID=41274 RepID=UPI002856DBA0|nr:Gfo/Idh/MocA family oxidoreductase [Tissierella sp.]MDR7855650.1 Gfo/Idh/MocA family oxidoreductase [Tissierella sp.]
MNIGIIGAGVVAERIINASNKHPRANIKGIYDVDLNKLKEVTEKYNLQAVDSYNDLLQDEDIDIIYLAVPPKFHYPIAMDILKTDKHFICEKPLANSTDEAREMYSVAKDKAIVHGMNFPTIYINAYKKMEELLSEGFIGDLVRVEFQGYFTHWPRLWQQNHWISSREQGGFVREVVTHYIQMIQRLFGDIEDVSSFIEYPEDPTISETSIIARGTVKGVPVLINGVTDIGMEEELSFKIFGTKGSIFLKNWRELWISKKGEALEKLDIKEENHLVGLLDNIFKAIDGEDAKIVDFEEGYKTHMIIEKLLGRE